MASPYLMLTTNTIKVSSFAHKIIKTNYIFKKKVTCSTGSSFSTHFEKNFDIHITINLTLSKYMLARL